MAGKTTAAAPTSLTPETITIRISIGAISIDYAGPKEFLKDLPAILAELQKFDKTVPPPHGALQSGAIPQSPGGAAQ